MKRKLLLLLLCYFAFPISHSPFLHAAPQAVYVNPDGSIVNTTDFKFKAHKIQICDAAGANCTAIDTDLDGKQPLDSDLTAIAGIATTSFGRNTLTIVDAPSFRTYIGAVIGTNVQAWDADLDTYATLPPSANAQTILGHTFSQMRTDLSLVIGTNVQAWDADLDTYAANTPTTTGLNLVKLANPGAITFIKIAADNTVSAESAATHRTSLGLAIGTNVQAWDADLDTYAALPPSANAQTFLGHTFTQMRSDLGLVIGTNVEAWDADLDTYAANTPTTTGLNLVKLANPGAITFIQINADNSVTSQTASAQRTALGLGTLATQSGTFSGTSSGTNTGDQTITLTGDVTGTGTGSFAATIANSAVTLAKMANMATSSLIYRKTAASGAPEVNTLATLKTDLGLTGTNSGDQTITLTGDVTGSGTGSFAATIANNAVTNAKAAQMAANTIKGNNTGSTANAADLTVSQAQTLLQINSSNKQTTTLGSAAASITFTVPSGYTHLRLFFSGRGSDAATSQTLRMRFGTAGGAVDTGNNYDDELLYASGTTAAAANFTATSACQLGSLVTAGSTASYPTTADVIIPNYAGTTFYKGFEARSGYRDNTTNYTNVTTGQWKNTGAITSIELSPQAGNFVTGTVATLIAE